MAEMWVSDSLLGHWRGAGVQLRGYAVRTARNSSTAHTTAGIPVLRDADGREIFVEMVPRCKPGRPPQGQIPQRYPAELTVRCGAVEWTPRGTAGWTTAHGTAGQRAGARQP